MLNTKEKIKASLRHIENVRQNVQIVVDKLLDLGKFNTARLLIAYSLGHDQSKFADLKQFNTIVLGEGTVEDLKEAVRIHGESETLHPEFYDSIHKMPAWCVAEMVCDWKARSSEFGKDIREWIDNEAAKRYGFTKEDNIYKLITFFLDMLLEKPFQKLN
jgi:hypothetical protein